MRWQNFKSIHHQRLWLGQYVIRQQAGDRIRQARRVNITAGALEVGARPLGKRKCIIITGENFQPTIDTPGLCQFPRILTLRRRACGCQ